MSFKFNPHINSTVHYLTGLANKNLCSVHNVHGMGGDTFITRLTPRRPPSVLCVGAVCRVGVVGQHVVVHVDGGAVVDGVTQTLSEDGLARVRRQAKQEEAGLCSREAVDGLKEMIRRREGYGLHH